MDLFGDENENDELPAAMDLELSGSLFVDFNDPLFVDSDLLKHVVEQEQEKQKQQAAAAFPPVQSGDESPFQKFNRDLAAYCSKMTQSLPSELGRLGWAQKRGAGDAKALAALRERCVLLICVSVFFFLFSF